MRIAVVGSGVSGLVSAWLLSGRHQVTLFESNDYLGGHTHTHDVVQDGRHYAVDSGFIVHNALNYPLLTGLFAELQVRSQPTTMSFAVHNQRTGLQYNASTLAGLFCQRRNLLSPRFLGMVRDLLRFYRESPELLATTAPGPTLGEYLKQRNYGRAFCEDHLVPMVCALWSAPVEQALRFPARFLVQFMSNHRMLQVSERPQWRVVTGGSATYIKAMQARWRVEVLLRSPVCRIERGSAAVEVTTPTTTRRFDQVVIACHSNQALNLLADASEGERTVLGAIPYQANEAVLHTDKSLLPPKRAAWAAWNASISREQPGVCTVSYCMNLLQGIDAPKPFVVTLNGTGRIDPQSILCRMTYEHPVYSHASVLARARKEEIQGKRRTWFAGAYWGWGFHEDGVRSAVEVVNALGVRWPLPENRAAAVTVVRDGVSVAA